MTFESQAASMTRDEIVSLLKTHQELQGSHQELQRFHQELQQSHDDLLRQVEWFKRQLFGSKSERRLFTPDGHQLTAELLEPVDAAQRSRFFRARSWRWTRRRSRRVGSTGTLRIGGR